jgi:hypothetical protein
MSMKKYWIIKVRDYKFVKRPNKWPKADIYDIRAITSIIKE